MSVKVLQDIAKQAVSSTSKTESQKDPFSGRAKAKMHHRGTFQSKNERERMYRLMLFRSFSSEQSNLERCMRNMHSLCDFRQFRRELY